MEGLADDVLSSRVLVNDLFDSLTLFRGVGKLADDVGDERERKRKLMYDLWDTSGSMVSDMPSMDGTFPVRENR